MDAATSDDPVLTRFLDGLPQERIRALYHAFTELQSAETQTVRTADQLAQALDVSGYPTCSAELKPAVTEVVGGQPAIGYNDFLRVAARVGSLVHNRAAMVRAFQAYDLEGRGYVTANVFRHVFERAGVPGTRLPPETVDSLLALGDPGDTGRVDYAALVEKVFSEHEKLSQRRALERSAAGGAGKKPGSAGGAKKK